MHASHARQGIAAYRRSQRQSLTTPEAILLALHEEIARELLAAKAAYQKKMLDRMCQHTQRVILILSKLKSVLNFEAAGKGGVALERYYTSALVIVSRAQRDRDPAQTFDVLAKNFRTLCGEMRERLHMTEKRPRTLD